MVENIIKCIQNIQEIRLNDEFVLSKLYFTISNNLECEEKKKDSNLKVKDYYNNYESLV